MLTSMRDTVVIIPVYNEEKSLPYVLESIPMERIDFAIVVDNGSTDLSGQIAKKMGAKVVFEKKRGYGQACLAGINASNKYNAQNIVFLDGDFSDDPRATTFIDAARQGL